MLWRRDVAPTQRLFEGRRLGLQVRDHWVVVTAKKRPLLAINNSNNLRSSPVKRHLLALLALAVTTSSLASPTSADDRIRVGWQTTWAVQGQLVMGLMQTPIGKYADMDLDFYDFPYGGPLNLAAIGGAVDVVLTADQPALLLLDRSDDFAIVGRMMYNRVCLYVPINSNIDAVAALAGKKVSGPVGAAAERFAIDRMAREGLDLDDITFGKLDMAQQSSLLIAAGKNATIWQGVDALYGFDPLPAAFENNDFSKMLDCGRVVSVVLMRKSTLLKQPEKAKKFMCAFTASWHQYAGAKAQMNDLFLTQSGLEVSHSVLDDAASMEPNFAAQSAEMFQFKILEDDLTIFDSANQFLVERNILKEPVDVMENTDHGPLNAAMSDPACAKLKAGVPYASLK